MQPLGDFRGFSFALGFQFFFFVLKCKCIGIAERGFRYDFSRLLVYQVIYIIIK